MDTIAFQCKFQLINLVIDNYVHQVSLVVTLAASRANLRPQRQDHAKPWSGYDVGRWREKMSDPLSVVAVLIATAAFAAVFNLPGGYGDDGKASLAFKSFLVLDTVAVAASVAAVILLIYGKGSRSAGSWSGFAAALHLMWVSLLSLMLALYAALAAAATTRAVRFALMLIYLCIYGLQICITTWTGPATTCRRLSWFLWQGIISHSSGRQKIIHRQYPLAGASVINFCLFTFISCIASFCFGIIFSL